MNRKTQKQEQYIEILEKSQQLKFRMPTEIRISKHNALYQASIQLEELYGLEFSAGAAAEAVAVGTRAARAARAVVLDGVVRFGLGGVGVGVLHHRQSVGTILPPLRCACCACWCAGFPTAGAPRRFVWSLQP